MNKKGSIIVFSLVFMLAFLGTVLSLSVLFLNELKINRNIEASLKAYYAAESGLERALQVVMLRRDDLASFYSTISEVSELGVTLPNDSSYEIVDASYMADEVVFEELEAYEVKQLDLYNLDDLSSIFGSFIGPSASAIFEWDDPCEIEVLITEWPEGSWPEAGAEESSVITVSSPAIVGLSSGYDYILRVRPLDCSLPSRLTVHLETPLGNNIQISNIITIKSQGTFGEVYQAMQAQFSLRAPLFDLGAFSLFSEEDIIK